MFDLVWFSSSFNFVMIISRPLAGCGPAATHFSCFAKKSKQKKATALSLPFGFPIMQGKKWESVETRFPCRAHLRLQAETVTQAMCMHIKTPAKPQTTTLSLSIFCPAQLASPEAEKSPPDKSTVNPH
ncbi:hypothetical protein H8K52_12145 [Undibacterium seohonense]|uniref:Secreted protein n=1 Tax=Undibacterium seohonense TaxID=1344950 RepID=A0ABR6X5I9_9BURK|nr:hypothetical protein [Undibacterium seohonense]MBC3808095.1 hypothetical protein [Undibacterium seohonense]